MNAFLDAPKKKKTQNLLKLFEILQENENKGRMKENVGSKTTEKLTLDETK